MLAMVIYSLIFFKSKFIYFDISIERKEQERKDKKNKDRKEREDASNGKVLIIICKEQNLTITYLIERREQRRKELQDRKEKEDASNGKSH